MSSFMISTECMNNIINGLYWNHHFKDYYSSLYEEQNLKQESDFKELANKLFKLNQYALLQRYPQEKTNPTDYIEIPAFKWEDKPTNIYQFLKSVQCLIYQCYEGDTDQQPLFKWLQSLEKALMNTIINDLPEYKTAEWG